MSSETKQYVLSDPRANSNKFWRYEVSDDGYDVTFTWGRVGETEQTITKTGFDRRKDLDAKIREKTKKGYKEVAIVEAATSVSAVAPKSEIILKAARTQLAPTLSSLVDRLVAANKHDLQVASGGKIDVDLTTGVVTTALGVIDVHAVNRARGVLDSIAPFVKTGDNESDDFVDLLATYLTIVPQRVDRKRGWHKLVIPDEKALAKQVDLLDQLEVSAKYAADKKKAAIDDSAKDAPPLFDATVEEENDPAKVSAILSFYESGINRMHTSSHLKVKRVYRVNHRGMARAFETDGAKLSNQMRLWHGTRTYNVLSILKSGLVVPRSGGSIQITGRMFGDGLYFSDQSTKSLNYAHGYWDRSSGRDDNCFMFLADVGMGRYFTPTRPSSLPSGYDSIYAIGGKSGVMNNEMIVPRVSQANIVNLVEFGP